MHFTVPEALEFVGQLRAPLERHAAAVDLVLLPPALMLWEVARALEGSPIQIGAQNAGWADQGPFTGEISPRMLAGWCRYVLIGHSERRQLFGETDEELNRKVKAALKYRLRVILAVGETLEENEAQRTDEVIHRQLGAALFEIPASAADELSIAYEPVWAIGTGKPATPEQASAVMGRIRARLAGTFSPADADRMRLLYGGSVSAANARELMRQSEIDGALVGGASLKVGEFLAIVEAAAEAARSRLA